MYVDLNPIRAAMAESPDEAKHTSAYDRIQAEHGEKIESAAFSKVAIAQEEPLTPNPSPRFGNAVKHFFAGKSGVYVD